MQYFTKSVTEDLGDDKLESVLSTPLLNAGKEIGGSDPEPAMSLISGIL